MEYLKLSPHYFNAFDGTEIFSVADEATIEVPAECLKLNHDVGDISDLRSLLLTVRYWLIPEYVETCGEVFAFVSREKKSLNRIVHEFGKDSLS